MNLLLIVPFFLDLIFAALGLISVALLFYYLHRMIVKPAIRARIALYSPPLKEGYIYEILVDERERIKEVTIGQSSATINTRMLGIKEEHLGIKFVKDHDLEEYDIDIKPGSHTFFRRPHTSKLEFMKGNDSFESRELIGYPALFRVAAIVKDNRPLQYLEFELTSKYIINQFGAERMKFFLKLNKIHPGLDEESRNKKGFYSFSRLRMEQEVESE